MTVGPNELLVCELGVVEYRAGVELQERVATARRRGEVGDVLLSLEHFPVYTRGRRSDPRELPMGEAWYLAQGIDVADTDRGGRLTYHGPGQLVGYPIVAVVDVVAHVRALERALVAALATLDIAAHTRPDEGPDFTGVWVAERKIASIGIHVAGGVATHGFALNVENDLQPFEWVVPCGLEGVLMTSVLKERRDLEAGVLGRFRGVVAEAVASELGRRARYAEPGEIEAVGVLT